MKKELDEQLCKNFPLTFRDRHGDMRSTCMCWGFDIGSGWFDILKKACEKIEPRIQQLIDEGKEEEWGKITASQCKEKYGSARLYFTISDPIINAAIDEFEKASETICEECGDPAKLRGKGWYYTACDNCHDERVEQKACEYLFYEVIQELTKRRDAAWKVAAESGTSILGNHIDDEIKHLEAWRDERKKAKKEDE